jgi:hypothetical protein
MPTTTVAAARFVLSQNELLQRVAKGQKFMAVGALLALVSYSANTIFFVNGSMVAVIFMLLFAMVFFYGFIMLCYQNVSFTILRMLVKEPNVVFAMIGAILNFIIDCYKPFSLYTPIEGFLFFFLSTLFFSLDAIEVKSRKTVLGIGTMFIALIIWNIWGNLFGGWSLDVVLFEYPISTSSGSVILIPYLKRTAKRIIFTEVLTLSMGGIILMFTDKEMKKLMFITGNIFRGTGVADENLNAQSLAYIQSRRLSSVQRPPQIKYDETNGGNENTNGDGKRLSNEVTNPII